MTRLIEAIKIALAAIWANKLRSVMMVLGNIVAVTSIIAVVSLVQGMNGYVSDAIISQVGVGTFRVERFGLITSREAFERAARRPNVTRAEQRALQEWSPLFDSVMAEIGNSANVAYREKTLESIQIRGVSEEYTEFAGFDAELGRLPNRIEIERHQPVALLGSAIAEQLFTNRNPLDQFVRIDGHPIRVVGVSESKGSMFGNSQDEFVVMPLGVALRLFGSRRSLDLTVKVADPARMDEAMDEARLAMRIRRHLRPKEPDDFGIVTSETLMQFWRSFSQGAFTLLIGIVSVSLVVGGIVIMNIMLMVVSERTREVGLRKSLGARRLDIVWQFLSESTTLSVLGGVIGTTLGFAAAALVAAFTPLPASISPWSVALGVGMTAIVGLFFGLYPAIRAARLDPIEALHKE
ncbi:MAG: FtsX-like permease family protein [Luteitalea sp.]|nr:FtsX-like permease family protein [Luteitalea sp.]